MAHVSQQLLDAVTAAITGLATTGTNVEQTRVYAREPVPALSVRLGERRQVSTHSNSVSNAEQDIHIDLYVAGRAEDLDNKMLQIDSEIHAALMADFSLGLSFVLDCDAQGLSEPDTANAGRAKAVATSTWRYRIRHSTTSLESP
ncbi:hypothetical protein ACJJH9_00255 (plasmid) [Microbulbifer sp. DLAB2-AF]|uniref:hypothetical protein n=1 Tax=Microbulbifer sp. DLAB2-AF TaxID=3243395 RepID=UPI0040399BA6